MNLRRITALMVLAIAISGCQNDLDMRYLDASVGSRLELPPDLIEYESESGFELPETFSGDDPSIRNKVPVLARVESLRVEGSEDLYWLSVEEPVDNLYQLVKNFWAAEGYRLIVDEPVIGIMQTEWIYKEVGSLEEGTGSWLERLFGDQDLSAVQDQFKTRIERGPQGESRIYVAHRGAEYSYVLDSNERSKPLNDGGDEDTNWRARQPDPELEIEMLSRMMIYLGLQQPQVDQQLANVKLFQPRAFIQHDSKENSPFLIIRNPYQIAWNRVLHNLERMNFDIVSSEFKTGVIEQVGIFVVNIEIKDSQKKGGLFSLVSGTESETRQIALILSEENHELTRVEIEDAKGEFDTSPEGAEFLSLLYRQIK
ncbi:MAG: outer membrane protein assembly factor BamC [Gammaproteobacteria bacterium]|nr:outer membrane protein assembly factor BamC [Gammaproteobacteria bacterium]